MGVHPGYVNATYGYRAYLIRDPFGTGAEVLYRYQDGVLTDVLLWPRPMKDRILRESGTGVGPE